MTLSKMDFWRLADELSIVDAAILMTGNDPSETIRTYDSDGVNQQDENGHPREVQRIDYDGYIPSFKALKSAILSNSLKANIRLPMRISQHPHMGEYDTTRAENFDDFSTEHEQQFSYDMLIARTISDENWPEDYSPLGQTSLNFDIDSLSINFVLFLLILYLLGKENPNSTSSWSNNGTLASRECAIVILSVFIKKLSGKSLFMSKYSSFFRKSVFLLKYSLFRVL